MFQELFFRSVDELVGFDECSVSVDVGWVGGRKGGGASGVAECFV